MNNFILIAGSINNPITGGDRYNKSVADFLKKKKALKVLITDNDFPRSTKLLRPLVYNFFLIKRLWLYNNYTFVYPLRSCHWLLLYIIFIKIFKSVKVVGFVHHIYSLHHHINIIKKLITLLFEKSVISLSDAIIVNSKSTKLDILRFNPRQKIYIVHPGTNFDPKKQISDNTPKNYTELLYVGTISRRKGILYLLKAIYLLKDLNIRLNIVGDTYPEKIYYDELRAYINKNSLAEKVRFIGLVTDEELYKKFRSADIFVLLSLWEGYGIVILEAMKYGLPIVATRVGAVSEIVCDGINGLLVAAADYESTAKALKRLICDEDLRKKMRQANIMKAEKFPTWSRVAENFYKTLVDIVGPD